MKMRLILTLVGLAISFALPTFAQQTNTPDPQLRQRFSVVKEYDDALDKNDAAAVAAIFTEDAVFVEPRRTGLRSGGHREISGGPVPESNLSNSLITVDEDSPHIIGTAGKEMWATGGWSATIVGQNYGVKGYWSGLLFVRAMIGSSVAPP